ncbi:MAG TPA: nuclear transport factor 2 family protein [Blastocatellia bacterium]
MDIEQNKKVASEFLSTLSTGDVAGALNKLGDDLTWWIAGKPGVAPFSGTMTKEQFAGLLQQMGSQLKGGLKMTVKTMTAEEDRVALEVESYGELKNGRVYNQEYHMLMTIRDGKISAVREYLDTQHVLAVWFQ